MSKNVSRKGGVSYKDANSGAIDKKHEGYSNLKGQYEQDQRKVDKEKKGETLEEFKVSYRDNLISQITLMEHEIKLMKEREVDQKNKASGYETLLKDGIPLNEHFLALKNKYNNEEDNMKRNIDNMNHEINKEKDDNKRKKKSIDELKKKYDDGFKKFKETKEENAKVIADLEKNIFSETHQKNLLTEEKKVLVKKVNDLRTDNQEMGRRITKDHYHNDRDETAKKRKKDIEDIEEKITKQREEIEKQQAILEYQEYRNSIPDKLKKR